ncbi:MAG: hypothetical protein ABII79_08560 [bacterium]
MFITAFEFRNNVLTIWGKTERWTALLYLFITIFTVPFSLFISSGLSGEKIGQTIFGALSILLSVLLYYTAARRLLNKPVCDVSEEFVEFYERPIPWKKRRHPMSDIAEFYIYTVNIPKTSIIKSKYDNMYALMYRLRSRECYPVFTGYDKEQVQEIKNIAVSISGLRPSKAS